MSEMDTAHAWWSRLRHQGMLLSPVVMLERFPDAPQQPPFPKPDRLRDAHTRFMARVGDTGDKADRDENDVLPWVDALLDGYVGHDGRLGKKGSIPEKLTANVRIGSRSETLRPHRVIFADATCTIPVVLVMVDSSPHVGRGRGRNTYARFLELLRGTGHRLGLLTNGQQFRLIYAGLDFESWCEWESDRWFDGVEGTQELAGLRQLLLPEALKPVREKVPGLLDAVEESRKRQADLSSVLRENVRQAVELLLEEVSTAHKEKPTLFDLLYVKPSSERLTDTEAHEALMQAAVRLVMRLVVCLFAESRQLLPVKDPIYGQSYGVRTLYELLEEAVRTEGGLHSLVNGRTAWPRLMALFRLVHGGSTHGSFPLRSYGGVLFRPGEAGNADPVSRALDVFERHVPVTDATIFAVLRKLLRGPLPVVRGRSKTFVEGPVDYTDLRTEFIGLIYEGLLDYRIKRVDAQAGAQVFLNLGREPVLPLSRLQEMLRDDPKGLKDLLTTLRKEKVTANVSSDEDGADEDQADDEKSSDDPDELAEPIVESSTDAELRPADALSATEDAIAWAKQAIRAAGLTRKQGKKEGDADYQTYVDVEAKKLINKVVSVGEFYLVRAGNTRKGTGTFYTRPQLAVPTVHRTLEPLCYDKQPDGTLIPKRPEVILGLKVCDPACGSASFLVAALFYITTALYRSLCYHCKLDDPEQAMRITLPFGKSRTKPDDEVVRFPPDDPHLGHRFEEDVKSRLRRHVVERCIYGVDINPLAIELARVSLWVETLDPNLPFSFLDHKIRVGNALVGCWLDRVLDYPLKAWEREGGDGRDGSRTDRIEEMLKGPKGPNGRRSGDGVVKQEMRQLIEQNFQGQVALFTDQTATVDQVVAAARFEYELLHQMAMHAPDERERFYRDRIENSRPLKHLKRALDEWCAIWFWPTDEASMRHQPTPLNFHCSSPVRDEIVERVCGEMKFFHWEVAFPDVFTLERTGFDATLGNPPWEVIEPNSQEFFSEVDPLFRTLDKQQAIKRQNTLLESVPDLRRKWDDYLGGFKAMSHWAKSVAEPFDCSLNRGRGDQALHKAWATARQRRTGNVNPEHPFKLAAGGKQNTYKLFTEIFWAMLRVGGRMGTVVPTGLYSDLSTRTLREELLLRGQVEYLYAFQNERKFFPAVFHGFKILVLFVTKGGTTLCFKNRFRLGVGNSPDTHELPDDILNGDADAMVITLDDIRANSPRTLALVELASVRDLGIFRRIYQHSFRVGDGVPGWKIEYAQEINMTSDSKLFPPIARWNALGYTPDAFGRWKNADGDVALAFNQGVSVNQFDFSQKGWEAGLGRAAIWREVPFDDKQFRPKFLIGASTLSSTAKYSPLPKLAYRRIARSTDTRSFISCVVVGQGCGDKLPVLKFESSPLQRALHLSAVCNSFTFDYVSRMRNSGTQIDWHILADFPLPLVKEVSEELVCRAARLTFLHRRFAPEWLLLRQQFTRLAERQWKGLWAVTEADRLRLRVELDAISASMFGLTPDDFDWILRDDPKDSKGFYRVERALPFRERLTGVASAAFRAFTEGKWSAESAVNLSNDEFFDIIGIPEMTSQRAAEAKGLSEPLIRKRQGCHTWEPETFAEEDPRYGWTWEHCWQDAVVLLGDEHAVNDYIGGGVPDQTRASDGDGPSRPRSVRKAEQPMQERLF